MFEHSDYRQILKGELERRCRRNPRYSLRAFARDLAMGSARLSEVLSRKTGLSGEKAVEISAVLGFTQEQTEYFRDLAEAEHARSQVGRELAKARLGKYRQLEYSSLETDHFRMLQDWYHFAIFELLGTHKAQSDARWIATALGIQEVEAKLALERLERLGFIEFKRKRYAQVEQFHAISSAVPSEAIQKFHRQVIEKAAIALGSQNIDRREFGATIMAVNRADLPKLKAKLRELRKTFNQEAAQASKKDSVYCLSTQLFELGGSDGGSA